MHQLRKQGNRFRQPQASEFQTDWTTSKHGLMNVKQSARNSFAPPTEANVPTTKMLGCGGTLLAKKKNRHQHSHGNELQIYHHLPKSRTNWLHRRQILLRLDNNSKAYQIHPSAYHPNSARQRAHSDLPVVLETYVQSSRNDQPMYHVSRKCWST